MDIFTIFLFIHLLGTILGVGGATLIELHLKKALAGGKMSPEGRNYLGSDFFITRTGLVLAILSGLGFMYVYATTNQLFRLESGVFWAKMAMVGAICVNAYLLDKHKIGLYWGSALSFVSWWCAFIAGFFLTNSIKIYPSDPVIEFIIVFGLYGLSVVAGAWVLHRIRGGGSTPSKPLANGTPPKQGNGPIVQTADEALGRTPHKPTE